MTTTLALWQELLLIGLAAVAVVYVAYFRIWLALAIGSDVLFVIALLAAAASITAPDPFTGGARWIVEHSPLPDALAAADARVAAIAALPSDLIDAALERLGYETEPDAGTDPDAPGLFVASVRPSIEGLVALVLRGATFACSGFLLVTALATRTSSTTARRLAALSTRVALLEQRAAADEADTSDRDAP